MTTYCLAVRLGDLYSVACNCPSCVDARHAAAVGVPEYSKSLYPQDSQEDNTVQSNLGRIMIWPENETPTGIPELDKPPHMTKKQVEKHYAEETVITDEMQRKFAALNRRILEVTKADSLVDAEYPDPSAEGDDGSVRTFAGGATRDTTVDKHDFAGFLSVMVLRRFGEYMHKHRLQSDGNLRDSDNWKKGMPRRVFAESLLRHALDVVGYITDDDDRVISQDDLEEALMALIFNAQGLAREVLMDRSVE